MSISMPIEPQCPTKQLPSDRHRRARLSAADGALVMIAKLAFRWLGVGWWHDSVHLKVVSCLETKIASAAERALSPGEKGSCFLQRHFSSGVLADLCSSAPRNALARRHLAIDIYMLLWTILLFLGYLVVYSCSLPFAQPIKSGTASFMICEWRCWLALAVGIISFIRVSELFSVMFLLHADVLYSPPNEYRAVINTLWHYAEVVTAFGTFYICDSWWCSDTFSDPCDPSLLPGLSNSLYFSFVTMTTLGYGDFAPQFGFGKFLVFLEVVLGLFILIVVVQRAIALRPGANGRRRHRHIAINHDRPDVITGSRRFRRVRRRRRTSE